MDGVDPASIDLRADTVVDVEGEALRSRPDDTSDEMSGASSPADPDPDDDDWVEA